MVLASLDYFGEAACQKETRFFKVRKKRNASLDRIVAKKLILTYSESQELSQMLNPKPGTKSSFSRTKLLKTK